MMEGEVGGDATVSQETPKTADTPSEARKRQGKLSPFQREHGPLDTLTAGFLPPAL